MPFIPTSAMLDSLAAAAVGHQTTPFSGPLFGSFMILSAAPVVVTHGTKLADLTQPTYAGYGSQTVAFNPVQRDGPDNSWFSLSGEVVFATGNDTISQHAVGAALVGSDSVTLMGVWTPEGNDTFTFAHSNPLTLIAKVQPRDSGDWGDWVVIQ